MTAAARPRVYRTTLPVPMLSKATFVPPSHRTRPRPFSETASFATAPSARLVAMPAAVFSPSMSTLSRSCVRPAGSTAHNAIAGHRHGRMLGTLPDDREGHAWSLKLNWWTAAGIGIASLVLRRPWPRSWPAQFARVRRFRKVSLVQCRQSEVGSIGCDETATLGGRHPIFEPCPSPTLRTTTIESTGFVAVRPFLCDASGWTLPMMYV